MTLRFLRIFSSRGAAAAAAVILALGLSLAQPLAIRAAAVLLFLLAAGAIVAAVREQARLSRDLAAAQTRVRTLENDLEQARTAQQRATTDDKLAAISKFSSVVSHEIKNPLASLKNIAYFLTKAIKEDDARIKKMLEMMSSELDRTNTMVNDLTNLSHIKRISRVPVALHELITGFLKDLKLEGAITIVPELEEVTAQVDPEKLKIVLANLLSNACSAMPNGGQVELRLRKQGSFMELTVKDSGTGIDKEVLPHIFEPMFTTRTRVLGLGLTVVKEIIGMHNGVIAVESEKGKGALFKITLPLE